MSLADHIKNRITNHEPISVAEYMSECLLHPTYGYYSTRDPFGQAGDFITAPEITQMFGEVIGLCLAQSWLDQGQSTNFILLELGPGRGTLMADILRATRAVPGFHKAAQITLVEASRRLREIQRTTLAGQSLHFMDSVDEIPQAPLYFVANEFFDALPIRQFQRDTVGWRERRIGVEADKLAFGLGPNLPQPALKSRVEDTRDGDVVEYAPAAAPIIEALSTRIASHGGTGLIIDYGDWRSVGNTLQALRDHKYIDVLEAPGDCDLTAHVDFEALAIAAVCQHTRLTPQGVFLERLGITPRAQELAQNLQDDDLLTHISAHRRLTHPEEMGNLFKVLGLYPDGASPPPGLEK